MDHEFTVKLSLDERQYERLCSLQNSVNARFPESPITLEKLFDSMIETGNRQLINLRLDAFERTYSGDAAKEETTNNE